MSDNAVVEMMQKISKRINVGEKVGEVDCPYCDGKVHYVYENAMAMRAKCNKCGLVIMA